MNDREFTAAITICVIMLVILAVLEFMAVFRHPRYKRRRAVVFVLGVATVLGISGMGVYFGGGHWPTWVGTAAFFVVYWTVKRRLEEREKAVKRELEGRTDERREWQRQKEKAITR